MRSLAMAVVLLGLFFSQSGVAAEQRALTAAWVFPGEGPPIENGLVIVSQGKIVYAGAAKPLPADCPVIDHPGAWLCPGLIDLYTALGAEGQNSETTSALQPEAFIRDVFHPLHEDFQKSLACGITTVFLAPSAKNVVGGWAQAVRCTGRSREERLLRPPGPMVITLAKGALQTRRMPTSRAGAVDLLSQALEPSGSLAALRNREKDCLLIADQGYDLLAGLALARKYDLKLTLLAGTADETCLERLQDAGIPLVFGPFDFTTPEKTLRLPARAAEQGIPFAFTARSPGKNPAFLRITAALAVREGLDRDLALSALTARAARIGGIHDQVGLLAPGRSADLVVFSDHPVNLQARLLKIYVQGEEVGETALARIRLEDR